jgi:hypothetical protein
VHTGYMAIEVRSELSGVNLLPGFSMHSEVDNFRSTLSITGIRSFTVGLVVPIGSPRFVNGIEPIEHCSRSASSAISVGWTFREIKVDF